MNNSTNKPEGKGRTILTPTQLKEAKRVLKTQHHCGLCNEFFESDYALAEHLVKKHIW